MTKTELWPLLRDRVARILAEDDIRPGDRFLELGGNSLLALQVASVLRRDEGLVVDITSLLTLPLGEIAAQPSGGDAA